MSPTVGFPTARLDRQFLTPSVPGYKMLRFLERFFPFYGKDFTDTPSLCVRDFFLCRTLYLWLSRC
ncbi:MAG: hypothetical protein ACRC11_17115, partial [Xenococcaceae cyanobacterium]